jgi:hypothetical protein
MSGSRRPSRWPLWVVLAVIVATAIVRARLAGLPLERDEGEYAYAGQLILQGVPPYALVYNMKFPGIYYAFALVLALFGQTQVGVHIGLIAVNAATILLVFLLGRRLFDAAAGAWAAAVFAVLSLSPSVTGLSAHATQFVLPPALGGLLLLLRAREERRVGTYVWSGVLLGVALLMKQHGVVFLLFALAGLAWTHLRETPAERKRALRDAAAIVGGAAIPCAVIGIVLVASGVFSRFWLWTFTYASQYVTERRGSEAITYFVRGIRNTAATGWPLWVMAAIGLALLIRDETWSRSRSFTVGLLGFTFLATVPGFYFRPHYFILMLPAIALLAGAAPAAAGRLPARRGGPAVTRSACTIALAVALVAALALDRERLFVMTPKQLMRSVYHQNPFSEALEVALRLKTLVRPGETIAVFGSEPEIFFYTGRRSATGYIYMYPLMENQALAESMRKDMLQEIEAARPTYAVFVGINTSWVDHASTDTSALGTMMDYANAHFDEVGLLEIVSPERTEARWGSELQGYAPRSPYRVVVLKRR